jgi:leader peptidase (prepilin peptidase)/N-methyltransferase
MGLRPIFDPEVWGRVPFEFWALVFFVFGTMVGSFLNVVIHRLPIGQSIVSPPSHCPHCKYSIPWYLNIPLLTWLYLGGRCKNCGAPISPRYFLVELLTGVAFASCWIVFGHQSAWIALILCIFFAGLIAATFIDFEHYIIPDEINIGGMIVGFVCSLFVSALQGASTILGGAVKSIAGILVGAGVIYFIVRMGKLFFGRQRIALSDETSAAETKIVFSETALHLPNQEISYEEIFYRKSDAVVVHAKTVELVDRCYKDVPVRLALLAKKLMIGDEEINPEQIVHMEIVGDHIILPREAMGFGDVKFMAAIGAFLGWPAVFFSLVVSSFVGAVVGVTLIAMRMKDRQSRIPYGPYIAIAAAIWVFLPADLQAQWIWNLKLIGHFFFRTPMPAEPPTM